MSKKVLQPIVCQICGETHPSNGIHTHLKWKHSGMSTKQYMKKFGDFRTNTKKSEEIKNGKILYNCKICNDEKTYTSTALSFHVIKTHKLSKEEYILKELLNGVQPLCKCGCGEKTKILSYSPPYCREYNSGHNKSTLGMKFSEESKGKMKDKANERVDLFKKDNKVLPWHSKESLNKRGKNSHKKSMDSKEILYNVKIISELNNLVQFECKKCNSIYSQYHTSYFNCIKCNPPTKSKLQLEVFNFIKDDLKNDKSLMDHRKTFNGNMEIDIFIPDKSIGIEFDGLYYHSETSGEKPKSYHLWKTNECKSKGIRLIHIFEDEWINKRPIVESKIKSILKCGSMFETIYARKCQIKILSNKDSNDFFEKNHIQGSTVSAISYGLFYNDKLVSAASFGKPTIVRGKSSLEEGEWELIRMATDIQKRVIGAAGKLLSNFVKDKRPTKIISYADKRFTTDNDNVYKSLGFSLKSESPPNYFYTNDYKNRLHRFNFTKSKLVEAGADPKKTEWEIMKEMGYDRIWDCGHFRYELVIN